MNDQNHLIQDVMRLRDSDKPAPGTDNSAPDFNVGTRLHELRKSRKMTLQEAAELTGVSASTWSKIERNELSPTISTMQRIAKGVGIELVGLLGGDRDDDTVPAYGRRCVSRAGAGSLYETLTCDNMLLCTELRNKAMTPILTRVTARTPAEYTSWARANSEVFLIVISGTLVVHSRLYEPVVLKEGDSMYYDANSDHAWTSEGEDDAKVLWVISII